jgi:hypothetical protein
MNGVTSVWFRANLFSGIQDLKVLFTFKMAETHKGNVYTVERICLHLEICFVCRITERSARPFVPSRFADIRTD